jgi:hypothetical protein
LKTSRITQNKYTYSTILIYHTIRYIGVMVLNITCNNISILSLFCLFSLWCLKPIYFISRKLWDDSNYRSSLSIVKDVRSIITVFYYDVIMMSHYQILDNKWLMILI